jgi:hypothetical protein
MDDELIYEDEITGTKLVNLEHFDPDDFDNTSYIGGEADHYDFEESVHKNPFPPNQHKADEAKEKYKAYFYRKVLDNEEYQEKVDDLKGKVLLSWMYPEHDHGEVIINYLSAKENPEEDVYSFIKEELENLDTSELGIEGLKNKEEAEELVKQKH